MVRQRDHRIITSALWHDLSSAANRAAPS